MAEAAEMNVLQTIIFLLAWPVVIGILLHLWANRVTMLPMQWNKTRLDDKWTVDLPDLDGTAIITATVPHEAEVHFGSGDSIHVETIGKFLRWDDAARMTENYIHALRQEVAAS